MLSVIILNGIMLSVINMCVVMLIVILLCVVMLNVFASTVKAGGKAGNTNQKVTIL